jgi:hypothetical protein
MAVSFAIAAAYSLALAHPAAAQFEELAAQIPASANAIVLLDGQRLLASPLAAREAWKEKYEQAFASGLVSIAPDTQKLVLAAQLDYEYLRPQWEVAVAQVGRPRAAAEIARLTKGTLDPIGDTPAVALRDNAYAIELGPKRVAAMAPANRQSVARWLREISGRTVPALSPYLKATLVASQQSAIVVAFDLEDAVPTDVIQAKLAASSVLKEKNIDVAAAAKALAGIRGLALEVAVTDGSFGRLLIHFNGDATVLAPVAKPLLLEILADLGASIDDIAEWKVTTEPQRIVLNGPLSAAGRKRVFSLIDNPLGSLIAAEHAPVSESDRQQTRQAAASQQYFKALTSVLDDVVKESKDAKTFGQNALWFDKWARKIDKLPLVNVDKELLDFGQYISSSLRNMAAAMRGIGIQSGARTAQVYQTVTTDYNAYAGVWGGGASYYTEWRNVDGERRAIRADERAKGATSARGIASEIENATAKVRQAMTVKYMVNF